jgi:ribulose-phosphate 3-epimerase
MTVALRGVRSGIVAAAPVCPFRGPLAAPLVGPSILSADFTRLGAEVRDVVRCGSDYIHVDIMDGHFVPNLSMGPSICAAVRRAAPRVWIDVHLMIGNPRDFIDPFVRAGANNITFHLEVDRKPRALLRRIKEAGLTAGIAIKPSTPWTALSPVMDDADLFLVMSVEPGFGGQTFMRSSLPKVRAIRKRCGPLRRVEMDGGIAPQTAAACLAAGCDTLVAGAHVFGASNRRAAIAAIRCGRAGRVR